MTRNTAVLLILLALDLAALAWVVFQ